MKYIKEFDRYQIDETGIIIGVLGSILKSAPSHRGYLHVTLYKDGKAFTRNVHRLVAETFIPNPLNLSEVNHKNGNKTDNRVENLEWCSHSENIRHALTTGLIKQPVGDLSLNSKLKEFQVREIRALSGKLSQYKIASLYGVTRGCIQQIINRTVWKHI